jgi:hypothetical protein
MKATDLYRILERYRGCSLDRDPEVVIKISLPFSTVGSQPVVGVSQAFEGIDWDSGKFILVPSESVTPSDRNFAEQMRKMQERAGQAESENRSLKAEIRRLKIKYEGK